MRQQLESGALETPKPGDPRLARCETHLIATPQQSLDAAAELFSTKKKKASLANITSNPNPKP